MSKRNKLLASMLVGVLVAAPFSTARAGILDWVRHLFGHKSTTETQDLKVSKLDSTGKWMCKIGGGCTGGAGICCIDGMKNHFQRVKGIEKFDVNKETGLVTLTIKKGVEVPVKEIQKALGRHWTITAIEKG